MYTEYTLTRPRVSENGVDNRLVVRHVVGKLPIEAYPLYPVHKPSGLLPATQKIIQPEHEFGPHTSIVQVVRVQE